MGRETDLLLKVGYALALAHGCPDRTSSCWVCTEVLQLLTA